MTIRHSAVAYPQGEASNLWQIQAWVNELLGMPDPAHPGYEFTGIWQIAIAADKDGSAVLAMAVMEIERQTHGEDEVVDEMVQLTTTHTTTLRNTPKLKDGEQ